MFILRLQHAFFFAVRVQTTSTPVVLCAQTSNDDDDADVSRDEVFALFLSKRRLWGREKTTTRERPSTQKRERRNDDDEEETNRTLFLVCAVTLGRARDADDKEAANINSVCTSSFIKRLWGTKKM